MELSNADCKTLSQPWHVQACQLHYRLVIDDPYSMPQPLHNVLRLDANEFPFHPPDRSSTGSSINHRQLRGTILKAYYERTRDSASGHDMSASDRIASEISSFLIDDEKRRHYAYQFVPILTALPMGSVLISQDALVKHKIKELGELCGWDE